MTVAVGTSLGRYEIRKPLGAGGMGEVYLAHDSQLDRAVALKILPEHLASDERRMRRFVHEAKAASALNHPNIITIHEVGQSNSVHYIATELIDGVTLRHLMTKSGMALRETFDIVFQVGSALTSSHAAGIVHRDIKPENIMLRSDGYVKVLDFGLAKLSEKSDQRGSSDPEAETRSAIDTRPAIQTEPGVVMGTVSYMSPEQARGLPVDSRSDIWSFGVVLFEMITGRRPFVGPTNSDVIASILEREPSPLARFTPNVPVELERIVSKSLSKDTEERYQTVKDLLIDLRRLKKHLDAEDETARAARTLTDNEALNVTRELGPNATAGNSKAETLLIDGTRSTSSAEYLVDGIKKHKKVLLVGLIVLVALVAVGAYLRYRQNTVISSVAVIPIVNKTGDAGMDALCDDVTDAVITDLSKLNGPTVAPSATSFLYKGSPLEPRKIGEILEVRAVLVGSISKSGNSLILKTELIDVTNNGLLWREQFNIDQPDLMGGASFGPLQKDMAKKILDGLRMRLTRDGSR